MKFSVVNDAFFKRMMGALPVLILLLSAVTADLALAKRGGSDENRAEFYGIVQARPETGLKGEWMIGGHIFKADTETEFDETEGPLKVGSCAKVDVRNGRVHEIDSEPMRDCQ